MKHAWGAGLLCGLILLLAGTVQADYVDSCVLIPDADGAFNTFDSSSAGAAHWTCVNDSCSDANRCDTDTSAKLYGAAGLEQYGITQAPDTSNSCDSMAIYCNWAEQRSGTSGEWKIFFGWRFKVEGDWYWCVDEEGTDTMIVNGTTCTIYRHSWTKDPCWGTTRGLGYVYFGGHTDDENEDYAWQPAFGIITAETGCFATDCIVTMFDVWVVLYFTVTEEEAAGQVIIISDAGFHRPPRAYLDWREQ